MLERMDMQEDDFSREDNQCISSRYPREHKREDYSWQVSIMARLTEPYRLNIMNALDIAEDKLYSLQTTLPNLSLV